MRTLRYSRGKLPHWEVEHGRYFVTVRCADSLPASAVTRLVEIQRSLATIKAKSGDFGALQRQYFRIMEKFLDAGAGSCPLQKEAAAELVGAELSGLEAIGIEVPRFTIMPNHWHAMIRPLDKDWVGLREIMKRVKGRTGKAIRRLIGGTGAVWQREWFDRWMRTDAEWSRCVAYVRNNPVKARLVPHWREHRWRR